MGRQIDRDTLRSILSPTPAVLIILGLIQLLAGSGVLAHKGWGRGIGILFALLGLFAGIFALSLSLALAPGLSIPTIIAATLVAGYAFILLALLVGGKHFKRRIPAR